MLPLAQGFKQKKVGGYVDVKSKVKLYGRGGPGLVRVRVLMEVVLLLEV